MSAEKVSEKMLPTLFKKASLFGLGTLVIGTIRLVSVSHAEEYYEKNEIGESRQVAKYDIETIEKEVNTFIENEVSEYNEMLSKGFDKKDIGVSVKCVKCASNRTILIDWLSKKYPNIYFSKSTVVERTEQEFSSAYDSDTYIQDTVWPQICIGIKN